MSLAGFERYDLPTGARYLKIHHYADPSKDEAWLESVRRDMADTPRDFKRQILMDEDVYDGEPVFPDYADSRHCPVRFHGHGLPPVVYETLIGGWDAGQTLHPAFVCLGITGLPHQVHCVLEVVRSAESMETFAPLVMHELAQRLPYQWADVRHFGDPTITTRSGTRAETAQQMAKYKAGITIQPSTNIWTVRKGAVDWLLRDSIEGDKSRFVLDPRCTTLRKGFQGAYHLNLSPRGDTVGDGRILLEPVKDGYSHPMDALQYAAIEAKKLIQPSTGGKVYRRQV